MLRYSTFRTPNVSPVSLSKNPQSLAVIQSAGSFFPLGTPLALHAAMPAEVPTKQSCLVLWNLANLWLRKKQTNKKKNHHHKMYKNFVFTCRKFCYSQWHRKTHSKPPRSKELSSAPWMHCVQNCLLVQITIMASWPQPSLPCNVLMWFCATHVLHSYR